MMLTERLQNVIVKPSLIVVPERRPCEGSCSFPSSIKDSNTVIRGKDVEQILNISIDSINNLFEREN